MDIFRCQKIKSTTITATLKLHFRKTQLRQIVASFIRNYCSDLKNILRPIIGGGVKSGVRLQMLRAQVMPLVICDFSTSQANPFDIELYLINMNIMRKTAVKSLLFFLQCGNPEYCERHPGWEPQILRL